MSIVITTAQLKTIYDYAEAIYPEECCGILLGRIDGVSKIVVEVIETINIWEKSEVTTLKNLDDLNRTKHSRYTISPRDILQAQKRGRDLQLDIVGFFHSHPDAPSIPSTCDRERAWEIYSYPIISVTNGKINDIKSWVLNSEEIFQLNPV
ncbi:M67 family metallopeptidase [Chamaesiphon sp.]|uniref:M67 family metallopeptidase n=1 Tax=Chamaesiphon sp. TaxID=2814140 RepID=UPI003593B0E1